MTGWQQTVETGCKTRCFRTTVAVVVDVGSWLQTRTCHRPLPTELSLHSGPACPRKIVIPIASSVSWIRGPCTHADALHLMCLPATTATNLTPNLDPYLRPSRCRCTPAWPPMSPCPPPHSSTWGGGLQWQVNTAFTPPAANATAVSSEVEAKSMATAISPVHPPLQALAA